MHKKLVWHILKINPYFAWDYYNGVVNNKYVRKLVLVPGTVLNICFAYELETFFKDDFNLIMYLSKMFVQWQC